MDLDYSKICRVCMTIGPIGTMLSLFKVNLNKKMMACTSLQIWPNDNLPNKICRKCVSTLHVCYRFKMQCQLSDRKLRNHLSQSNQKTIECSNKECIEELNIPICKVEKANLGQHEDMQDEQFPDTTTTKTDNTLYNINNSYNIPREFQETVFDSHFMAQNTKSDQVQIKQSTTLIQTSHPHHHQEEEIHKCSTCSKIFKTAIRLKIHKKIHNPGALIIAYKCDICNKGFGHVGNYRMHMRKHNNERPFVCIICGKGCRQAQDLEKHVRTHTGEKPHKCDTCPRAFATRSNLIAHIRTHTGEKPYVCLICQKGFCQSSELTKHTRSHTGEKTHFCDICHKGFNGSGGLIAHRRCHTERYICIKCNSSFTTRRLLTAHAKQHEKKHLNCKECNTSFTVWNELQDHFISTHNRHIKNISEIDDEIVIDDSEKGEKLNCTLCGERFDAVNVYSEHLKIHSKEQ